MAYQKQTYQDGVTEYTDTLFEHMDDGIFGAYPVQLIAISDTAPSTCAKDDKYYNSTSKKIFTATGTNTWGTNGETPLEDTSYWLISENGNYAWDGTDLVSIGGGKAEVVISDEEPEDGKLWVDTAEIPVIAGREHLVQVSDEVDEDYRLNLLKSKNLCSGYNQSLYINSGVNQATIVSGNTGLYIPVSGGDYTISTTDTQTIYRVGLTLNVPNTNSQTLYSGINKDNTSDSITIDTTGYNFLCITCTDLSKIQIEKGSTATTYEAFIPNQIVVDNEKYTDTINVGNVVDSRSRVNVLKSNNLFNKNGFNQFNGYVSKNGARLTVDASSTDRTIYMPCKPNTSYTISKIATNPFYICTATTIANNTPVSNAENKGTATTYTITSGANDKYLCLTYYNQNSTQTQQAILDSIMINEGDTALPYEPYIIPSIYVDNEMLVSKNIYSRNEAVIGEWLGKPLYRKVVDFGALPNTTSKKVSIGVSNIDVITKVYGMCDNNIPIPYVSPSGIQFAIDIYFADNKTNVVISTGINRSTTNAFVILEYTKTTD